MRPGPGEGEERMDPPLQRVVCPYCHTEMETTGTFCTECGARLNAASSAPSVTDASLQTVFDEQPTPSLEEAARPAESGPSLSWLDPPEKKPSDPVLDARPYLERGWDYSLVQRSVTLSAEEWMQVLTALGHYAGVLRGLMLGTEGERATATYQSILRQIGSDEPPHEENRPEG